MCYPKPGPRCSHHAMVTLEEANLAFEEHPSLESRDSLEKAREEFFKTPKGFEELERFIEYGDNPDFFAHKLAAYKQERSEAIAALKNKQTLKANLTLSSEDETIYDWRNMPKAEASMLEDAYNDDANRWVEKLTEDEKAAVVYYTGSGFHEVGQLERGEKEYSKSLDADMSFEEKTERIKRMTKLLESALDKSEGEFRKSYRGISPHSMPAHLKMKANDNYYDSTMRFSSEEEQEEAVKGWLKGIQEKGTVTFTQPASASANPAIAAQFSNSQYCPSIIFEIVSKKGVPIGSLSTWKREKEVMMKAGTYKVVGVRSGVNMKVRSREDQYHVIQLMDED